MAQAGALIKTLKRVLKNRGLAYRDVAQALALSEASVKRLFAAEDFSLSRLERICTLAGMDIAELVREMEADIRHIDALTEEQEREVVSEPKMLLVAFLVVNGWRYEEILAHYALTEPELITRLTRLDRLRVIELLPGNRIKLLISPNFAWRRNGPIQQFFATNVQSDFLHSDFDRRDESMIFLSGMLSPRATAALTTKMAKLAADFSELRREDGQLPLDQKRGCGVLLALRAWSPEVFCKLRR